MSKDRKLKNEEKIFAKNTIFAYLNTYSSYFFSILTSFLIARIISREIWGILITTLSTIALFNLFSSFLPPSMGISLNYYIPKYRALEEHSKVRSFIIKSTLLRIIFISLIFLLSLFLFTTFAKYFKKTLNGYLNIFYLLSPLIIIFGLDKEIKNIFRALNKYDMVNSLLVLHNIVYSIGLLYIFFFINSQAIEMIALNLLISYLIPFFLSMFYLSYFIKFKLQNNNEKGFTYYEIFKSLSKYGFPLAINSYINGFIRESRIQLISLLEGNQTVTGFNIALNYSRISADTILSLNNPLTNTFTSLYTKEKITDLKSLYNLLFRYSLFLLLFVSGILFLISDFFLFIIYGEDYLDYEVILKLTLLSVVFNIQGSFFHSLIRASNKINYILPLTLLSALISFPSFCIGLFLSDIHFALIGLIIGNFINFIIISILNKKIFKIGIKKLKILMQYIIFFFLIFIIWTLENFFLNDLNRTILAMIQLSFFSNFNFFSFIVFIFFYFFLNFILKTVTKRDIDKIEILFKKPSKRNKQVRKILGFLKRFMRS